MASAHARASWGVVARLVLSKLLRTFRHPFGAGQETYSHGRAYGHRKAIQKVTPPDGPVHTQIFVPILIRHEKPLPVRRSNKRKCDTADGMRNLYYKNARFVCCRGTLEKSASAVKTKS